MSKVRLVLFQEADGAVPLRDWLDRLPMKAIDKCLVRLERLEELGHDLRRPEADLLREGIYELRTKQQAHVPPREIGLALRRKEAFEKDPDGHTFDRTEYE